MKTLDEVIELCEKILAFAYLPKDDTTSTAGIALFYLREYREIKNHLACMNNAEIRGDSTQIINNPPLTWDELKSMEGKPVWVEYPLDGNGYWILISVYDDEMIGYEKGDEFGSRYLKETMGTEWYAYRKEREFE